MPSLAFSLPGFHRRRALPAPFVLGKGYRFKMSRVHASAMVALASRAASILVVTYVVDSHLCRNRAKRQLVRDSVNVGIPIVNTQASIASESGAACPQPTAIRNFCFRPETLLYARGGHDLISVNSSE